MTVVARFEIESIRFIGNDGMPMAELPAFARDRGTLAMLYRAMVLTRTFDAKAVALQRTGRLGTYASSLGQEGLWFFAPCLRVAGGVPMPELDRGGRCHARRNTFPLFHQHQVPSLSEACFLRRRNKTGKTCHLYRTKPILAKIPQISTCTHFDTHVSAVAENRRDSGRLLQALEADTGARD